MIHSIVRDVDILSKRSNSVHKVSEVDQLIKDMIDTANVHETCIGLAAIQIGINKRVCIVKDTDWLVLINPVICSKSKGTHISREGCLSLEGTRDVKRYNYVKVLYLDKDGKAKSILGTERLSDVIQHEIDHMNGKLI